MVVVGVTVCGIPTAEIPCVHVIVPLQPEAVSVAVEPLSPLAGVIDTTGGAGAAQPQEVVA